MIRGAGRDHSWDAATKEWLQAAPASQTGWAGDVSLFVRAPVPPRIVLHAANVLQATEIHTWGHDAATIRWHPPEDGAARLAVAHFKTGGPVYNDALSRLDDTRGPMDECQWDILAPHLTRRHVYMATPPQGHPRPAWDDLIAAFQDQGILSDDTWREVQRKTLGRDYRRRVRARLLEIRDPLR